jgi:hypothetical protein
VVGPVTPRLRERHSGPRHGTSSLAALTLVGCHPVGACVASTPSVMLGHVWHATQEDLDRLEVLLLMRAVAVAISRQQAFWLLHAVVT